MKKHWAKFLPEFSVEGHLGSVVCNIEYLTGQQVRLEAQLARVKTEISDMESEIVAQAKEYWTINEIITARDAALDQI